MRSRRTGRAWIIWVPAVFLAVAAVLCLTPQLKRIYGLALEGRTAGNAAIVFETIQDIAADDGAYPEAGPLGRHLVNQKIVLKNPFTGMPAIFIDVDENGARLPPAGLPPGSETAAPQLKGNLGYFVSSSGQAAVVFAFGQGGRIIESLAPPLLRRR